MRIIAFTIYVLLFLGACSCKNQSAKYNNVRYAGALKNMMHKGDLSAKAYLDTLKDKPHLYAIGAMADLKGEIQIIDGQSYSTSVIDSSIIFQPNMNQKAALLVWTNVAEWTSIEIPDTVKSKAELEFFVSTKALEHGLEADTPFPFLLAGEAKSISWHVINWPVGDSVHTHQKHVESGLNGTLKNTDATFLGFYSNAHHAIFTHHSTNMHIHFKTENGKLAGHVDDLILKKGMVLRLPTLQ